MLRFAPFAVPPPSLSPRKCLYVAALHTSPLPANARRHCQTSLCYERVSLMPKPQVRGLLLHFLFVFSRRVYVLLRPGPFYYHYNLIGCKVFGRARHTRPANPVLEVLCQVGETRQFFVGLSMTLLARSQAQDSVRPFEAHTASKRRVPVVCRVTPDERRRARVSRQAGACVAPPTGVGPAQGRGRSAAPIFSLQDSGGGNALGHFLRWWGFRGPHAFILLNRQSGRPGRVSRPRDKWRRR